MASTLGQRKRAVLEYDDDVLPADSLKSASSNEYQYGPLPDAHHIRVIDLLPGEGNTRLECEFAIARIDDPPRYRAISYTWRDSKYDNLVIGGKKVSAYPGPREEFEILHPVWCKDRYVLVATNLRDALRRFRNPTQRTMLWIDALCINQVDLAERANQVILMPKIYHKAQSVWFWMGESDEMSRLAIQSIIRFASELDHAREHGASPPLAKLWFRGEDACRSIIQLLQRPVFQRVWIVQELVAAGNIVAFCGEDSLLYSTLQIVIHNMITQRFSDELTAEFSPGYDYFHCISVIIHIQLEWYSNRRNVRQRLVLATRNFLATDPRDKVFALMGLLNDFAHRRSCHLGLCDASHNIGVAKERGLAKYGVDVVRNASTVFGTGSKAVTTALREFIAHETNVLAYKRDRSDADAFRLSADNHMRDLFLSVNSYLSLVSAFVQDRSEEWAEDKTKSPASQWNQTVGNHQEHTNSIHSFITTKFDTAEAQRIQRLITRLVRIVERNLQAIDEVMIELDCAHEYKKDLTEAERWIAYYQRLMEPQIRPGLPVMENVDPIEGRGEVGQSPCDLDCFHDFPREYDPGQVAISHMAGCYILACSSCDTESFTAVFKSIARSTVPPKDICTLTESSWRLLKATIGDLGDWEHTELRPQVFTKGNYEVQDGQLVNVSPSFEKLVTRTEWLSVPCSQYIQVERESIPQTFAIVFSALTIYLRRK
jgi:hypothetical protein